MSRRRSVRVTVSHRSNVRGVVGQVEEQADVVHGTVLLKVGLKEAGCLHVHLEQEV